MTRDTVAELVAAAQEMLDAHTAPKPARGGECNVVCPDVVYLLTPLQAWNHRRRHSRMRLRQALLDHESADRAKGAA